MTQFNTLFTAPRSIIGMLHLLGRDRGEVVKIALEEARILAGEGFDGVIVENYFGSWSDVSNVVFELAKLDLGLKVGINVLGDNGRAFELAGFYKDAVDFVQLDSVAGHLTPAEEAHFSRANAFCDMSAEYHARRIIFAQNEARDAEHANELANAAKAAAEIAARDTVIFGGVRFKYQPVRSGRTEAEDVRIGAERCDAIVVTSEGTGIETSTDKIDRFRQAAPEGFPLIVGAGLNPDNVAAQMANAQGGIVGSWLKENHVDKGRMSVQNVQTFMKAFRAA